MADQFSYSPVLNTDVGGTNAAGLGVPVYDAPTLTAEKVLWHAVQTAEIENKRAKQAAREAEKSITDLKIKGWQNHLEWQAKEKNDILNQSRDFLIKSRGKRSWKDYDPNNAEESKSALSLQERINKYQELQAFSEQTKQDLQATLKTIQGNPNKYSPESIKEVEEYAKLSPQEAYDYVQDNGHPPALKGQFPNWKSEILTQSAKLGKKTVQLPSGDYSETTVNVEPQKVEDLTNEILLNDDEKGQYIREKLAKEMQDSNYKGTMHDYLRDNVVRLPQSTIYRKTPTAVATAQAKKKVGVEYVPINKIVESEGGEENIPLEYQGKKVYYDTAGVLNPNDTKDVHFGDITELYKVITDKNGNIRTESVSTEEKSKFRPTMSLHNSKTGTSALMMVGTEGKEKAPTDREILSYIKVHPDIKKRYDEAPEASELLSSIFDEVREGIDKESGKKTVRYIAPMDATLQTNFNQIVDKPYTQKKEVKTGKKTSDPLGIL